MPEYLFLEAVFGRYCRRHGLERHVACSARVFSCKKDPRADAAHYPLQFFGDWLTRYRSVWAPSWREVRRQSLRGILSR